MADNRVPARFGGYLYGRMKMSVPLSVKMGFAAEVAELFAKGKHAGLSHEDLASVAQGQLELEKRLKESHDRDQRFY